MSAGFAPDNDHFVAEHRGLYLLNDKLLAAVSIAYDNLKCAITQVGKGKGHKLNKQFKEPRAWYLFDTRFCSIAMGYENRFLIQNIGRVRWLPFRRFLWL